MCSNLKDSKGKSISVMVSCPLVAQTEEPDRPDPQIGYSFSDGFANLFSRPRVRKYSNPSGWVSDEAQPYPACAHP